MKDHATLRRLFARFRANNWWPSPKALALMADIVDRAGKGSGR
jgi:hypothetical protein